MIVSKNFILTTFSSFYLLVAIGACASEAPENDTASIFHNDLAQLSGKWSSKPHVDLDDTRGTIAKIYNVKWDFTQEGMMVKSYNIQYADKKKSTLEDHHVSVSITYSYEIEGKVMSAIIEAVTATPSDPQKQTIRRARNTVKKFPIGDKRRFTVMDKSSEKITFFEYANSQIFSLTPLLLKN